MDNGSNIWSKTREMRERQTHILSKPIKLYLISQQVNLIWHKMMLRATSENSIINTLHLSFLQPPKQKNKSFPHLSRPAVVTSYATYTESRDTLMKAVCDVTQTAHACEGACWPPLFTSVRPHLQVCKTRLCTQTLNVLWKEPRYASTIFPVVCAQVRLGVYQGLNPSSTVAGTPQNSVVTAGRRGRKDQL